MKRPRHPLLSLEHLEDRTCPSLVVQQTSSELIISGTPKSTTAPLTILGTGGANKFQILDGTSNLGTFAVNNLIVNLTNRPNDLDLNLNGGYIPGEVEISLGSGYVGGSPFNAAVNISSGTTAPVAGGVIRGNLIILGGNGQEFLEVGSFQNLLAATQIPRTPTPITVLGNFTAATNENANGLGNFLQIGAGTQVSGSVQTTYVDDVAVGEANNTATTTIGGNLTAVDAGTHAGMSVDIAGVVNGNVSVNAEGFTPGLNEFTLEPQTASIGAQIGKTLSVNLGNSAFGNLYTLEANTTIGGATTLTNSGVSTLPFNSLFDIEDTINGSLTLNLGGGDNAVMSDTGVVFGNLTINGGNGVDTIMGSTGPAFDAVVAGNLTVTLGNGDDSAVFGNPPGGVFRWTSGNGTDSLDLEGAAGKIYNLNLLFGTGANTLAFDSANNGLTFTGVVKGTGGTNTFTQGASDTLVNITFINFP